MVLVLRFNRAELVEQLRTPQRKLNDVLRDVLPECGPVLLRLARSRFDTLSAGATVNGERWMPLKESTIRRKMAMARRGQIPAGNTLIGVSTGFLRDSLYVALAGRFLKLKYSQIPGNFFTHDRRLLPKGLPREWRAELNEVIQGKLDAVDSTSRAHSEASARIRGDAKRVRRPYRFKKRY